MSIVRFTVASVLVAAAIALIPSIAAADPAPGSFQGDLSHAGVALVSWGGGTPAEMEAAAPSASSFWMGSNGDLIGWIVGAPSFVNSAWNEITQGQPLPPNFQMMVIVEHDSTPPPQKTVTPTPTPSATPTPTPTPKPLVALPPTTSLMYPLEAEPAIVMTYQQSKQAGMQYPGISFWDGQPGSNFYSPVTGEVTAISYLTPVCSTDAPTTPAMAVEITTHDGWVILIQNLSEHEFHVTAPRAIERGIYVGETSYGQVGLGKHDPCFLSSERLLPFISLWIDGVNVDPTPFLTPYVTD